MSHLSWARGGEATFTSLDDDRILLTSTISSPPGSRLDGTLPSGLSVRIKIHSCRKVGESFSVEGRTIDLRRDARAEVLALISPAAP